MRLPCIFAATALFLGTASGAWAQRPLDLRLPTDNTALFTGDPSDFYMYTLRNFEGVSSKPWTGGQYGYVRDAKRTAAGVIMTRFHEGIDIKPARRDSAGEPLDDVRPIAPGTVVHASDVSSHSSYGRYVVVEHDWGYGPFYSLYAHLKSIQVKPGQRVEHGTVLGRLGYTGAGIDRERAHVHVELNLLLSRDFERWHNQHHRTPNHHGIYNGLNLTGIDLAALFLEHRKNPSVTIPGVMRRTEEYYRVRVPNRGPLELVERYPFLGESLDRSAGAPSWEISFSAAGIPLKVTPSREPVSAPAVSWVKHSPTYHAYHTRGYLSGSGNSASLTAAGLSYVSLVTGQF